MRVGLGWISVDADHLEDRDVGGSYKEDLKRSRMGGP